MYLVAIAWAYVVIMMSIAEALSPQGSVLGALFTLLLYGVLPLSVLMYILGTPLRRRARRAQEQQELAAAPDPAAGATNPTLSASLPEPDGPRQTAGDTVTPVRKEP